MLIAVCLTVDQRNMLHMHILRPSIGIQLYVLAIELHVSSGGSRGGSRGVKEPPFHQELVCKANPLTNLPEAPALGCSSF